MEIMDPKHWNQVGLLLLWENFFDKNYLDYFKVIWIQQQVFLKVDFLWLHLSTLDPMDILWKV